MIIFRPQGLLIISFSFRHLKNLLATDGFAFVALGHGDGGSQAQTALAGQIGHLAGGKLLGEGCGIIPVARLFSNSVITWSWQGWFLILSTGFQVDAFHRKMVPIQKYGWIACDNHPKPWPNHDQTMVFWHPITTPTHQPPFLFSAPGSVPPSPPFQHAQWCGRPGHRRPRDPSHRRPSLKEGSEDWCSEKLAMRNFLHIYMHFILFVGIYTYIYIHIHLVYLCVIRLGALLQKDRADIGWGTFSALFAGGSQVLIWSRHLCSGVLWAETACNACNGVQWFGCMRVVQRIQRILVGKRISQFNGTLHHAPNKSKRFLYLS